MTETLCIGWKPDWLVRANYFQLNPETQVIIKFLRDPGLILAYIEHWCLSMIRIDGTQWGVTDCDSFYHLTITPLHHFKYTFYRYVWVQAMLIVLNESGIGTYVLIDKRWICGLHNLRANNTLITSIYLCCFDTWKTNVYVYLSLLSLWLCTPVSVDLRICRIETLN